MDTPAVFTAVSTSARQLYLLLRCISFTQAVEVQITAEGLRFSAEEARVIQGLAFLEKSLFSSFTFTPPPGQTSVPSFQVSLSALLETLQIFGLSESTSSYRNQNGGFSSSYATAFNTPALALGGTCRISYSQHGAPLSITISESDVTTTCDLTTYNSTSQSDEEDAGIPLDRNALTLKIIMRSTWLHDAIAELTGTNPTTLLLNASSRSSPYLALEGEGGPFGDSTVDFTPELQKDHAEYGGASHGKKQPLVTETFQVSAPPGTNGRVKQRYKFDLVKKAGRAMALASKVSLRQDRQGVLSLQFMIEVGETGVGGAKDNHSGNGTGSVVTNGASAGTGRVSFVDFRFVPLVDEDDEDDDDYGDEEPDGGSTTSAE